MKNNNKNTHDSDQINALIQQEPKHLHDTEPSNQGVNKVARRTITIAEENERNLNQFRGWLLKERNKDFDYTRVVNLMLAWGFNRIMQGDLTDKEIKISNKYFFDTELQSEAIDDEHWNYWMKNVYPEMVDRLEKLEKKVGKKSKSNSVKRKKKDDVHEPE